MRFRCVFALLLCASAASAVEPSIRTVNVRGLQVGGTTELVVDGDDLTTEPKLLLPFAIEQELKSGSSEKKAAFIVKVAESVQPGYYQLRVATTGGVSLPVVIGVDRLPSQELKASLKTLPVAVHGTVASSAIAETRFTGKGGEAVTVEVEAQRFGSKLRPVLHLYDDQGKQLAWAWPQPSLFGDARLETTLPADGEYRVTCHDLEYAAANPGFFRMKIGQWTRIEQIFPAVVAQGTATPLEVRTQAAVVQMTADQRPDQTVAHLPVTPTDVSGPRPFVRLSAQRELLEAAAAGEQSLAAGPLGISGQLKEAFEEDRFSLAVKPGDKLRCEVFAQRYGSAIDSRLIIRNEKDAVLTQAEDSPGSLDPLLEYTVPDKVTAVQICVVESQGRSRLPCVYHLNLRNANDSAAPASDFRLLTSAERTAIPQGGRWVVPVWLERRGYQGAVDVIAHGLPAGLSLGEAKILPGSDGALVTITAGDAEPAADQLATITRWQGQTADGKGKPVVVKNHPLETLQPWLAEEIAIARINSAASDFSIEWRDLPETAGLQPTAKLPLPIKVSRTEEKTAVRLSLLTSQLAPLGNNNQPDPRATLRVERAIELGAKMNDGELVLLVPADLPSNAYDVAVQAELLSADKQKVLATAFTPVRNLPVQLPVEVQLAGESKIDVMLDPTKGATQKVEGLIKRREGIVGDVVVSLTGLPAGIRADTPTLKGDAASFTLTLAIPPGQLAGELTGKLLATIVPDPKQANVRVKSREVELKLNIIRP